MKLFEWDEKPTLLLADDDPVFRTILAKVLTADGSAVLEAATGEEALDVFRSTPGIDLAILDIEMPGLSGIDVAEQLHPLPVLFVTHHQEQHIMAAALKERTRVRSLGYVPKQFEPSRIALIVRAAVSFARETRVKQQVMERTARALEGERRRIAQELHDEIGQSLVMILFDAKAIEKSDAATSVKQNAKRILDVVAGINIGVHRIIESLRPEVLDTLGIRAAIESMVADLRILLRGTNIKLTLHGNIDEIDRDISAALYRIVQECLTNIAKYAGASEAEITVTRQHADDLTTSRPGERLIVEIVDNGVGFDVDRQTMGFGLDSVNHRATALGGSLQVESGPGQGTRVRVEIPLKPASD
jgi:signal transduction histidine kinase